jgi:NAD(P)-dependent dehydrogenase (short-subunit alcohol dehydrogenase family)
VVLGASGGVGRGIVAELLAAGHAVVAVGRSKERLATLMRHAAAHRGLTLLCGSVATDAAGAALAQGLRELPARPVAVVASVCGPSNSGRLLARPGSFLQRSLEGDVVSHFIAAKHLLPMVAEAQPEGLYLIVSGPAADCPWSGYGHRSIAAAALRMLTLVLREEAKELPASVQQLQIGRPVRTEDNADRPEWLGADEVGRAVVRLIERRDPGKPIVQIGGYLQSAQHGADV